MGGGVGVGDSSGLQGNHEKPGEKETWEPGSGGSGWVNGGGEGWGW